MAENVSSSSDIDVIIRKSTAKILPPLSLSQVLPSSALQQHSPFPTPQQPSSLPPRINVFGHQQYHDVVAFCAFGRMFHHTVVVVFDRKCYRMVYGEQTSHFRFVLDVCFFSCFLPDNIFYIF